MRLSDKQLADIMSTTQDISQKFGAGIVMLLGGELLERRAEDPVPVPEWVVNEAVTNETLMDAVLDRINKKEAFRDADVLGVFNAFQRQGYFSTITFVDSKALRALLYALSCPEQPHLIRELQATRGLPTVEGEPRNPIDQLIVDEQKGKQNAAD